MNYFESNDSGVHLNSSEYNCRININRYFLNKGSDCLLKTKDILCCRVSKETWEVIMGFHKNGLQANKKKQKNSYWILGQVRFVEYVHMYERMHLSALVSVTCMVINDPPHG